MANDMMKFEVTGVQELTQNLMRFGSPKMLGKIVGYSLADGAKLGLAQARVNARAMKPRGLGFVGFVPRRSEGESHGQSRRYGRIPRSLKVNKVYIPRGSDGAMYRMNIVARTQRSKGIYRNKAPHAHLIEYGFTHTGSGAKIAARPFMGPALDRKAPQMTQAIAKKMSALIDGLKFPVTGRGP